MIRSLVRSARHFFLFLRVLRCFTSPGSLAALRAGNSKFEYRNSKQYQNPNDQNSKPVLDIWILNFEFVSDFGFRASDFQCEARRKPCWARLGFPHSEIPGSQVASHLPGAYRRHATSFIASISRDIHHRPLISVVSKFPKWIWRTLNCQRAILSLSTLSIPSF